MTSVDEPSLTSSTVLLPSAHRFGQTDNVKIYKITVDDTIEDR
jgi:hypothetical protein